MFASVKAGALSIAIHNEQVKILLRQPQHRHKVDSAAD